MALLPHYPTLCAIYEELKLFTSDEPPHPFATPTPPSAPSRMKIDAGGRDLTRVSWPGAGAHWLTKPQALVVNELLDALMTSYCRDVDQAHLIRVAGTNAARLSDVFRNSTAWGTLVVPGETPGTYRLPTLPEPPPDRAA